MGIGRCVKCDGIFDTDADPDCFVDKPNYTNTTHPVNPAIQERVEWECVCEACREDGDAMIEERNEHGAVAEIKRTMVCPYCGCTYQTHGIGAVFCGPHGSGQATTPAVQMIEENNK